MSPTAPCQANGETTCTKTPVVTDPVSLCEEHALQVSLQVVPGLLSRGLAETRSRTEDGTRSLSPAVTHMVSSAVSAPMPETESHASLVYFLANGGRVKIGQTRNLRNRIRSLSLRTDAVLLLLRGGDQLERALHNQFAAHRVADSEWFELTPEIIRFIANKDPKRNPGALTSRNAGKLGHRDAARDAIKALYGELGRRPLESEMVAALKKARLPHSRQFANARRLELERDQPGLAALGSDNVRALTGTDN